MRRMVTDQEIAALGGTKLYKHTVTLDIDIEEEEPVEVTLEFISLTNTSFVGKAPYEINDLFINGVYIYRDEGDWRLPILYIDLSYNEIKYYGLNGADSLIPYESGTFKTDTVVAL